MKADRAIRSIALLIL